MYTNTRFGELMKGMPRGMFERFVKKHQADKYSKGFRRWDQFTAMLYGQVAGSKSLRELELSFNSHEGHHYHLGTRSIKRSTLSDANNKRNSAFYEDLCRQLLGEMRGKLKSEMSDMLYLLDSTPIPLRGLGYEDWAANGHRTPGLKVHMMIEGNQHVPVYGEITPTNVNDIDDARQMDIESGATYVFDKGYYDFNWWHHIDQVGAYFVTRSKKNAAIKVVAQHEVDDEAPHILSDETVCFSNRHPGGGRFNHYRAPLRRVTVHREDHDTALVLLTNDFKRSAEEIAALYKQRWQIELFFKWLKQNLKIRRFLGRSETAVKTQIYIAIITYILMWLYRGTQGKSGSLTECARVLAAATFQRPVSEYRMWKKRLQRREELLAMQGVLI
jgi:IS4 transposase